MNSTSALLARVGIVLSIGCNRETVAPQPLSDTGKPVSDVTIVIHNQDGSKAKAASPFVVNGPMRIAGSFKLPSSTQRLQRPKAIVHLIRIASSGKEHILQGTNAEAKVVGDVVTYSTDMSFRHIVNETVTVRVRYGGVTISEEVVELRYTPSTKSEKAAG